MIYSIRLKLTLYQTVLIGDWLFVLVCVCACARARVFESGEEGSQALDQVYAQNFAVITKKACVD